MKRVSWCEEGVPRCGSWCGDKGCQVRGRVFPGVGKGSSPNVWVKGWAELVGTLGGERVPEGYWYGD